MGSGRTDYGGTPDELLAIMSRAGITHAVMVNMTPVADMMDAALGKLPPDSTPGQRADAEADAYRTIVGRLRRRNAWTCEVGREHPELVPFIGLDPGMSEGELLDEIDQRRSEGARGIKLHPAAQRFYPNDERLAPVYARATELGWPVIFHSGAFALGAGSTTQASLENFPPLLKSFPKLTVVLGHMGFGEFDTCAEIAAEFPNAMFDCCFVVNGTEPSPAVSDEEAAVSFRKVGDRPRDVRVRLPVARSGTRRCAHWAPAVGRRRKACRIARECGASTRAGPRISGGALPKQGPSFRATRGGVHPSAKHLHQAREVSQQASGPRPSRRSRCCPRCGPCRCLRFFRPPARPQQRRTRSRRSSRQSRSQRTGRPGSRCGRRPARRS